MCYLHNDRNVIISEEESVEISGFVVDISGINQYIQLVKVNFFLHKLCTVCGQKCPDEIRRCKQTIFSLMRAEILLADRSK